MAVEGSDHIQIQSTHITLKLAWRNCGKPLKASSRVDGYNIGKLGKGSRDANCLHKVGCSFVIL
jgi:hypothetical protein